jgi:hypothetical protein
MPRGFFSQGVCLLLSRPVSLDELEPLLVEFEIAGRNDDASAGKMSGPSLTISFRREVNGCVVVDLQNERWPDGMGDPKTDFDVFGAWTMGHYGPFTYPGNLLRATQQAWTWKEAAATAEQHQAFLRIKSSYVAGAGPDAKILPPDYEPVPELEFVVRVAVALSRHPAVLAYFNPGGEVLLPPAMVVDQLTFSRDQKLPALDVWSNVRLFNPNNGWLFMDTIGMEQIDIPDHEACFPKGGYEANDVANMLRNVCLYRMQRGDVLQDGNTMDGPGGIRWRVFHVEESLAPRPRRVLRWFPDDGSVPPGPMQPPMPREEKKPGLFSRVKNLFGKR